MLKINFLLIMFSLLAFTNCTTAPSSEKTIPENGAKETQTTETTIQPNIDQTIYVITGGPGSGKTTVLNQLKSLKFLCFDEAARQIIQDQIELKGNAIPWQDRDTFNKFVLERMIEKFYLKHELSPKNVAFFDRGIPDIIGYQEFDKNPVLPLYRNATEKFRYNKKVFIAPPWKEIYTADKERKETFEQAVQVYEHIRKAYEDAGYELYELPKTDVKGRVKFILDTIKK